MSQSKSSELDQIIIPGALKKLQNQAQFTKLISVSCENLAKKHPQYDGMYLPIEITEQMLDAIFPCWSFIGTDRGVIANSVYYEGILTVKHPVTGDEIKRSGIGAIPIQLKKGASPMDIDKINSTAVQKNLPAAKSFAFNNAARSMGNLFGRNLNRKNSVPNMSGIWTENEAYKSMFDGELNEVTTDDILSKSTVKSNSDKVKIETNE